ncbi:MAG: universal stress protein [Halomonadaceae bacterium]|nr:MAG: universal stress protein [Halomonadaceae bacterium]
MMYDIPEKLLVAVDGSGGSSGSVSLACAMASGLGIPVELVFVFQAGSDLLVGLPGGGIGRADRQYFIPGAIEKLREEATKHVFQVARESVGDREVVIEETVLSGTPADQLLKHASDTPGAAIVMGRRGQSGLTELIMGSVSQRVIHKAKCPVILVP